MTNDPAFESALNEIKQRFLTHLDTINLKIEAFQHQLAEGQLADFTLLEEIQTIIHKLAGSSGTFGFARLTELSTTADQKLAQFIQAQPTVLNDELRTTLVQMMTPLLEEIKTVSDHKGKERKEGKEGKEILPTPTNIVKQLDSAPYPLSQVSDHNLAGSRENILIVDDDPIICKLLKHIFDTNDYQTVTSKNYAELKSNLDSFHFDLIILDLNVGKDCGLEMSRYIRQQSVHHRDIPIIFITASGQEKDENACWDAGATDFVTKPINIKTILNRAKSHLKLKKQNELLKSLAFVDNLTQVYNRRYFDEKFPEYFQHHHEHQIPFSLLMIDIDYFKRYNDCYGHLEGDSALTQISSVITQAACRAHDRVCRFGGEEFVVLLPETTAEGAIIVAQNMINAVQTLGLAHKASPFKMVTVSIGCVTTSNQDTINKKTILKGADEALYEAKLKGRNQYVCHQIDHENHQSHPESELNTHLAALKQAY